MSSDWDPKCCECLYNYHSPDPHRQKCINPGHYTVDGDSLCHHHALVRLRERKDVYKISEAS